MGPRTFATVPELLWYNCSSVCGSSAWQLCGGAIGDLLPEDLCHTRCLPGLLQPEPQSLWQATADPCLCRRHSSTHRQVWLSLLWVTAPFPGSWYAQGFVCTPQASLVDMRFDSKCGFAPPTILLDLLLCPSTCGIFFWWYPTFSC